MKLKTYSYNWFIYTGILFYSVFILTILFFPEINFSGISRSYDSGHSFLRYTILAVIVAPILEEITFRGIFSGKSAIKKISGFLLILIFCYTLYSWFGWITSLAGFIFTIAIGILVIKKQVSLNSIFFKLGSILLFALAHYQFADFKNALILPVISAHFGIAFLLTWIVINFSLLKSMAFHAAYNLVLLLIGFFSLQFVAQDVKTISASNVEISYSSVPLFKSTVSQVSIEEQKISAKNATVQNLLDSGMLVDQNTPQYKSIAPFAKFDFEIRFNNFESDSKVVLEMLEKEKLIVKVP